MAFKFISREVTFDVTRMENQKNPKNFLLKKNTQAQQLLTNMEKKLNFFD
jgi:hypothetical protein